MNILTKTFEGNIVCRPDTTWEKDNEDFYPPEFVRTLTFTPVFFARVRKPGRSIGMKFASRYYDNSGFGILLYPENMISSHPESYAQAICLDKTSFLPSPCLTSDEISSSAEKQFILQKNDSVIFSCSMPSAKVIEEAIVDASGFAYIRTGDIIAVELASRNHLCSSEEGDCRIMSSIGNIPSLDFRIIF